MLKTKQKSITNMQKKKKKGSVPLKKVTKTQRERPREERNRGIKQPINSKMTTIITYEQLM